MKWKGLICLLLCTLILSCGEKKTQPVSNSEERPWIELKSGWEWKSGGEVEEGEELRIGWGEALTAVRWNGEIPKPPFELELEAKRVDGTDFFCAVTFPTRNEDDCVTLVLGGWGGGVVGISSVDGMDASENETSTIRRFETGVWYSLRLVCEEDKIQAWIDGEQVVDLDTKGKKLSLRPGPISDCAPFGLATWQTTGLLRNIKWRSLSGRRDDIAAP